MPELQDQAAVNYRTAEDGMMSCSNCANFRAPDQCQLVKPPVGAGGVCDIWSKMLDERAVMEQLFGGGGEMGEGEMPNG